MKRQTTAACVMCGSTDLRLDQRENIVGSDGVELRVPMQMHVCTSCGTEMTLNDDLRSNARAMRGARKKHVGLLSGEEVRAIRKKLGLSQDQAAKVFGGGPVAFSKYENDEVTQSDAMDRLIWLADRFPQLVRILADRARVEVSAHPQINVEKRRIDFDVASFDLAVESSEANLDAICGFAEIGAASNDGIYRLTHNARASKWSLGA